MSFRIEPGNVVTFSVGLIFIAAAIYIYTSLGQSLESAQELTATVVDVVYETGTKKGRIHPTVRFRTRDGREVVATAQQHQNVQPGQTLQVLYDPVKPQEIEIDTLERVRHRRALFTGIAAALGLLVCTLGVGLEANTLEWRFKRRR